MTLNLLKKYNELLDLASLSERDRISSVKRVFDRDIRDNPRFYFLNKPIFPTPRENGEVAMQNLFNHLTRKKQIGDIENHRSFDMSRSQRLHWIRFHIEQKKKEDMLIFSVDEPQGIRTYIYDIVEKYVIVLEPGRKYDSYYLLTAYHLEGKDEKRNKILSKYRKHRLPVVY